MPTPPAFFTARLFAIRATTPRWQRTMELAGRAGANATAGLQSALPCDAASTIRRDPMPWVIDAPVYDAPFPSVTVPWKKRRCVLAPTVVTHGAKVGLPIVPAP